MSASGSSGSVRLTLVLSGTRRAILMRRTAMRPGITLFIGRTASYSFFILSGAAAGRRFHVDSIESAFYASAWFIGSQVALLGGVYAFTRIDWKTLFDEHRLLWIPKPSTPADERTVALTGDGAAQNEVGLKEFVTRASEEQAVLTTVRLVLRRPAEADLPSIVKHANDWEVARLLGRMPHPYTMDDARFFLEKVVPNELTWAITSRGDDTFIGAIGLAPGVPGGVAELGYWLGRCFWGNGFATEAGSAVVQYAFRTLGLGRLTSGYFTENLASDRVLTKLGFVKTGEDERQCLAQRKAVRSVEMELARL